MKIKEYKHRMDKYGQEHKAICVCGIESNWHTSPERARVGLQQEHKDKGGCNGRE